jgi:DNA-binding NarL/FixJ family response regulator
MGKRRRDPQRLDLGNVLAGYDRQSRRAGRLSDASAGAPTTERRVAVAQFRAFVADICRQHLRLHAHQDQRATNGHPGYKVAPTATSLPHLSPRMEQTLRGLLSGESEKQIARDLSLSRHTVHVYVKALYREFAVNSRGELLARFVVGSGVLRRPDQSPVLSPSV